jgi:transcription elongation GreA/GreB family factor
VVDANVNKHDIITHCLNLISEKISVLRHELNDVHESQESEQKNSAGDKYETGTAMLHQQKEKLMVQLNDMLIAKNHLEQLKPNEIHHTVQNGSFVKTPKAQFFIAVHIGKIEINGLKLFAISLNSPVAKSLLGKSAGDEFDFNGNSTLITSIF